MNTEAHSSYAAPIEVLSAQECTWYHSFDLPDSEEIRGRWDFRKNVDAHFDGYDFSGKRVLEFGPASGFLTVAMEQRGAEVVGPHGGNVREQTRRYR